MTATGVGAARQGSKAQDQAYHDEIAASYDRAYEGPGGLAYTRAFTRRMLQTAPIGPGALVLDLGCGTGRFSAEIARQSGATVVSVDLSRQMCRIATANLERQHRGRVVMTDAESLPFRDGSFDLVFCFGVLHHVVGEGDPECRRILAEMARLSRGRVLVVEPNIRNPYFFLTTYVYKGLQKRVAGYPRVEHERPLTKRFVRRAMERAGLRVDAVHTASPVEAFLGARSGWGMRAAQWLLERPLRPFGTHIVALGSKRPVAEPHRTGSGASRARGTLGAAPQART